jgi:hypothetical protein
MTMRDRWESLKKNVEENQAVKKAKGHFSRHKVTYISSVASIVTTVLVTKALSDGRGPSNSIDRSVGCSLAGRDINNTTINHTTVNVGNDALSYITREVGTENFWLSQAAAAKEAGIHPTTMSSHINHGTPLASGRIFERVGIHG